MRSGWLKIAFPCAVGFFLASAGLSTVIDWTWRNWDDIRYGQIKFSLPWHQEPVPNVAYTLPMGLPGAGSAVKRLYTYDREITLGSPDRPRPAKGKAFVFDKMVGAAEDPRHLLSSVIQFWQSSAPRELIGIARKAKADAAANGEEPEAVIDVTNVFMQSRDDPGGWPRIKERIPCGSPCLPRVDILPRQFDSYRILQRDMSSPEQLLLIVGEETSIAEGGYRTLFIWMRVIGSNTWSTLVEVSPLDPSRLTTSDIEAIESFGRDATCSSPGASPLPCLPMFHHSPTPRPPQ